MIRKMIESPKNPSSTMKAGSTENAVPPDRAAWIGRQVGVAGPGSLSLESRSRLRLAGEQGDEVESMGATKKIRQTGPDRPDQTKSAVPIATRHGSTLCCQTERVCIAVRLVARASEKAICNPWLVRDRDSTR